MKEIIKKIRAIPFINLIIRKTVKFFINVGIKIDTTHFIVSGVVKIILPHNEKFKLFSKGDDFIPSQVYWKGYEGYEYSIIPFYYLSTKSNVIIDIGANIGYYSLVAATANINSKIYAFEPVDRIVNRFNKQIEINNFNNIKVEKLVVGDTNDKISFYIPKGNSMALASSTKKGWVRDTEEVRVNSITLDNYSNEKNIGKIDLIKMDCEFHELEVLRGMKNILEKDKPLILMEILFSESEGVKGYFENSQSKEIENIMLKNNYYFYLITSTKLIRVDKLVYNKIDRNYLFSTKKSKNTEIPYHKISDELV